MLLMVAVVSCCFHIVWAIGSQGLRVAVWGCRGSQCIRRWHRGGRPLQDTILELAPPLAPPPAISYTQSLGATSVT